MRKFVAAAVLALITLLWEFLLHWSLVDALIVKLRASRRGGAFMVSILTSLAVRITLACIAIALAVRGFYENRRLRAQLTSRPVVEVEPPSNIQLLETDWVLVQQAGGRFDESPAGRDAAIVEFGNEASSSVGAIGILSDVDAQLFYWADGVLLHRTHHGFWLGQESPLAQFPRKSSRKLLLAMIDENLIIAVDNTEAFSPFHLPKEEYFAKNVLEIEVQLTAGEHAEWTRSYMFKLRVEPRAITYHEEESS